MTMSGRHPFSQVRLPVDIRLPAGFANNSVLILQNPQNSRICVAQNGTLVSLASKSTHLPTGPYAIRPSTGEILRVSRLYQDDYSAFIGGSLAFSPRLQSFHWLSIGVSKLDHTLTHSLIFNQNRIAVPSRLGSESTPTRPLAAVYCPSNLIFWIVLADRCKVTFRCQRYH